MPSDPDRVRELFHLARALPAGEREAFLRQSCGDEDECFQRVWALVSVLDDSNQRFGCLPCEPEKPTIDDRFHLVEKLGEGGTGEVWLAEQMTPVRRVVAVKILHESHDQPDAGLRFEQEGRMLALMDHPNIARFLDCGLTPTGRPYLVMEYVRGTPITDFCNQKQLTLPERLRLFHQVCAAVQHAHQKAILHRDLKPANCLVTLYDGVPTVKVIDFGISKSTGARLTERPLHTLSCHFLGTPTYVSPEQAELNNPDIDVRSDVYSLGVLLYELLAGSPPQSADDLATAGLGEILRRIREDEPPRPSERLATSKELPALAQCRQQSPQNLPRAVRGDLDWIVLKAIDKDRNRRYDTANSLARDVERYLAEEPIDARPPSATYRLWKFARRHRATVAVSLMLTFSLIVALVGLSWGYAAAVASERVAQTERQRASEAATLAQDEAGRAGRNETIARQALDAAQRERDLGRLRLAQSFYTERQFELARKTLDDIAPSRRCLAWSLLERRFAGGAMHLHSACALRVEFVRAVALSADGERIATGDTTGGIRLYNARTGECLAYHREEMGFCNGVDFMANGGIVSSLSRGRITIRDQTGKPLRTLDRSRVRINDLQVSADGQRIAFIEAKHTVVDERDEYTDWRVIVWDVELEKECFRLETGKQEPNCLALSPDGAEVAIASEDDHVRIWSVAKNVATFEMKFTSSAYHLAYSGDMKRLLVCVDGKAQLVNRATQKIEFSQAIQVKKGDLGNTAGGVAHRVAALSADGSRIAALSPDGMTTVWEVITGAVVKAIPTPDNVETVLLSPDGARLVFANRLGTSIQVVPVTTADSTLTFNRREKREPSLVWSADGSTVLLDRGWFDAKEPEGNAGEVWNLLTRQRLFEVKWDDKVLPLGPCALSRDGSLLAITPDPVVPFKVSGLNVLDRKSEVTAKLERTVARENHFAISPDGKRLAIIDSPATGGDVVRIRDIASGQMLHELKDSDVEHRPHRVNAFRLNFSPDGSLLAIGSFVGGVSVWDANTGKFLSRLPDHPRGNVYAILFDPTGRYVVSAVDEIQISTREGTLRHRLHGHKGSILTLCMNRTGDRLISASSDRVIVWDFESGLPLVTIARGPGEPITGAFLHDNDEQLVVWKSDPARLDFYDLRPALRATAVHENIPRIDPRSLAAHGLTIVQGEDVTIVREIDSGKERLVVSKPIAELEQCTVSPDGGRILLGYEDGTVLLYDLQTRVKRGELSAKLDGLDQVLFSPDGMLLVIIPFNGPNVRVWKIGEPKFQVEFDIGETKVFNHVFALTDAGLFCWHRDGTQRAWDHRTGRALIEVQFPPMPDPRIVTTDGRYEIVADNSKWLKVPVKLDEAERQRRLWATRPDPEWHARRQAELRMAGNKFGADLHERLEKQAREPGR